MLHRLDPASTAYNMVALWGAPKDVAPERLVAAIETVVQRHEILRARFLDDGSGVPTMQVGAPAPVEVHDVSALPEDELQLLVDAAIQKAAHSPFDLASEPPIRFAVYRRSADRLATLVTAHHIAVDAWSMTMLEREIADACTRTGELPAPDVQYADYAAWQRRTQDIGLNADVAWWKKHLAGIPPVSTFPPDRPRSSETTGSAHEFCWSRELSDGIRAVARESGATVYMALLAACAAAIRWQTGQQDIVLGSPMGDRDRPELETVVGPFVNLLVLRLDASGDPTFGELLERAREAVFSAHEHRTVAFEKLVEELKPVRSFDHAPLFQVAVVQHNAPTEAASSITGGGAIFDLTWFVREVDGQLAGSFEYRADLYSSDAVARIAARLEAILTAAVADRQRRLSTISLLTDDERRDVLTRFNDTRRELDPAPFPAQLERQARATPDVRAVAFEGSELTYAELNRRANQLASHLGGQGIGRGAIVGLCMPRSLEMVVALVAIQKSGAAYLPLDPDFPADRLGFMLADSGLRALVTNGEVPFTVPEGVARVDLGASEKAIAAEPGDDRDGRGPAPTDLAYVIYTSGSTGRPKGVRIAHGALSNFLGSMRTEPGIAASDVLAAVTTLSFDIAGLELYLPLTVGARVQLVPKETAVDGVALAEALASSGATILQATPSTWRLLIEAGWRARPGFRAFCGGEALPHELANAILEQAELWNLYGPTETTIWSTLERVEATGTIRIGRPIANTRVYVLNGQGQPLPVGTPGEIWIGGAGLAEGYHERPELTAERFVPDPFDDTPGARMYRTGDVGQWDASGRLEHLGRVDHQVKVPGFRIELGEIESVLTAHPAVRHAFVLAREAGPGDVRLVAYVGYQPGEDLTVSDVRRHLRTQLPDYMVPSVIVTLDAVPLTPNGKLDRASLPDPFANALRSTAEHVPPAPGMEQTVAEIWQSVLKVTTVSATDNFFELGGHSLLSLRVAAMLEKRTGWRMDPRMLFFQSLRQVAAAAAAHASAAGTR